jgi:hypothetical protein
MRPTDPFERAHIASNTYRDWSTCKAYRVVAALGLVEGFLKAFGEFLPRRTHKWRNARRENIWRESMDLNIRLIHSRDFIKLTPTGELDLKASKRLLLEIARENASPGQYDILIDHRQATAHLSLTDVTELVQVMIEHRESFRSRLAILTRPEATLELAKFLVLYAGNRGFRVRAFRDFEDAMNWLMTSTDMTSGQTGESV